MNKEWNSNKVYKATMSIGGSVFCVDKDNNIILNNGNYKTFLTKQQCKDLVNFLNEECINKG